VKSSTLFLFGLIWLSVNGAFTLWAVSALDKRVSETAHNIQELADEQGVLICPPGSTVP